MNGGGTKERSLRFEVRVDAVAGKPIVGFAVAKPGGAGPRFFTFAGYADEIDRLAADLTRAVAEARLLALVQSRRSAPRLSGRARQ